MGRKNISQEKIIQAFLASAFEKSAGATSLSDIADYLEIKKASLYNHFQSRDAMYEATVYHCGKCIEEISFLPEKSLENIKTNKLTASQIFKKFITRYFELYDSEPLFQVYTFIRTEQYFNREALIIVQNELKKINDEVFSIIKVLTECGKLSNRNEKELKELASSITVVIIQQRDFYIATRKETVRQNPDCGAGSLFALPTDDKALSGAVKLVENLIKIIM
ncbi:MAG: TetR/AcrR family transcriptional regulator [Treponema sp.]|nr:TetR/AcrR family transcriptional regulator [Spirochaetales bacterium]MDY6190625.1 TetR/AcrR family transcriptional regulator [Treponema sp.]